MSLERQLLRNQLKAAGYRGKKARRGAKRNQEALQDVVTVRAVQRLRNMTPVEVQETHFEVRRQFRWWRRLLRFLKRVINW